MNIVLMLCIIFSHVAFSDEISVSSRLESIIKKSHLKASDLTLMVDGSPKAPLFSLNPDKALIPASITKLITSAAVLNAFPLDQKFHTQIYTSGSQDGETLTGDIYIKGLGDPAFVSEKMWMLVNDFLRSGIRKVTGNLVADDSYFDQERFDPGREDQRNDRAYDAPVGALSFNWNSTTIYVRPGKKEGDGALVFIDPQNDFVKLVNSVKTGSKTADLGAERTTSGDHDTVTVRGKISMNSEEKHIYKDITSPPLYTAYNLAEFLKERGVTVSGEIKIGQVPPQAKLVTDFEGEPLGRLILDMNKFSNNYIAEMLTKNLAATKSGPPGKMTEGLKLIQTFLTQDLKMKSDDFSLTNVSGFTRKNRFSSRQFVDLLRWVQRQFTFYPEYLQSLPVAGRDGTLQKRMKGSAQGWVRAKTGLLNGVVALAGFAGNHRGDIKIFAFIYNGSADEGHVRETFDAMASELTQ